MSQPTLTTQAQTPNGTSPSVMPEAVRLRDLSAGQWRSGLAAWLGWLFDGLDMHLYTAVALPFVAELLHTSQKDPAVGFYSSWIQAAFLLGWALGGGFFGRIGDRLGRARALMLTILTYAMFTGLSVLAVSWWDLMLYRFLAALGIGGEWAVGAALLSETWPRRWRPWLAAVLQSAVNVGILIAMFAVMLMSNLPHRLVFLVGILPALIVLWIRRAVPETVEWQTAKAQSGQSAPRIIDLFRGSVRRTTILTILVCSLSLSAHWAFMFWYLQHLRVTPELADWTESQKTTLAGQAMILLMLSSIAGNFVAGGIARLWGYRRSIILMFLAYFIVMCGAYMVPRSYGAQLGWIALIGVCQGVFGLFTMYLPPLFPTLLRTTGAGFSYNIGRIAAAVGTVFFGLVAGFSHEGDFRWALLAASFLFLPAAVVAMFLHEPGEEPAGAPLVAPAEPTPVAQLDA